MCKKYCKLCAIYIYFAIQAAYKRHKQAKVCKTMDTEYWLLDKYTEIPSLEEESKLESKTNPYQRRKAYSTCLKNSSKKSTLGEKLKVKGLRSVFIPFCSFTHSEFILFKSYKLYNYKFAFYCSLFAIRLHITKHEVSDALPRHRDV